MNLSIAGMGWVTPLGSGIDSVWQRLLHGDEAATSKVAGPFERNKSYSAFRVPPEALSDLPAHARLRRASAISKFSVAAGLAALKQAGSTIVIARTALIFAVANGGVSYTRRFYHDIVKAGASSASPLLFPETVFNAPASHLAALLGLSGASYTLVGDAAVGILAIQMAHDLMADQSLDYCLVVGAEEADWVLCDAYSKWRLTRAEPPIALFCRPPRGTILSEGAGALLLARDGPVEITKIHAGGSFIRQQDATERIAKVFSELADERTRLVISSANGTFVDLAEQTALSQGGGTFLLYSPKPALGESVGASGLWQVITGAQALLTGRLPPLPHNSGKRGVADATAAAEVNTSEAIVLDCGLNQQIAGLRLAVKH
jgi:3-oxoacyl-(acyl-carrier-protein) synthase